MIHLLIFRTQKLTFFFQVPKWIVHEMSMPAGTKGTLLRATNLDVFQPKQIRTCIFASQEKT